MKPKTLKILLQAGFVFALLARVAASSLVTTATNAAPIARLANTARETETFLMGTAPIAQAQPNQLRACPLTSRTFMLSPYFRPTTVGGSMMNVGKHEYRFELSADLIVEARLKTDSPLRMDIYAFKPPRKLQTGVDYWSEKLSKTNEYAVVINNCSGATKGSYKIEIKVR